MNTTFTLSQALWFGFGVFVATRLIRPVVDAAWRWAVNRQRRAAAEVLALERYRLAVDQLDKWCGYEIPQARLIAQHLHSHGEGLHLNAGTPVGDEPCTINGLREQLRRLAAKS